MQEIIFASVPRKDKPEYKEVLADEEVDDFDPVPVEPRI